MIHKWVYLYHLPEVGPCFAEIKVEGETDHKELSICGVEGPLPNGDSRGSCGQCNHDGEVPPDATEVSPFAAQLLRVWERWHLNDMRPGCEHQRAEGWSERPIDPSKPLNIYGKHFEGQRSCSWNMLAWVLPSEHPDGLLTKPCPTCGYRYGTAWLYEPLPGDVIGFLEMLPDRSESIPACWRH